MALFEIKDLSFKYNGTYKKALNNISLNINSGEILLICGESATGKSTFLRQLKPSVTPGGEQGGEIRYNGEKLQDINQDALSREIGFVFQNPDNQIVCDKVFSELAFGLENAGLSQQEIGVKIAEISAYFGIEEYFNQNISTLSGGQKQILNLACVTAMGAKVLVLDEPTSQLDPVAKNNFINIIKRLNSELSVTIIICEHNLDDFFDIADRVCVFENGEIINLDTPKNTAKFLLNSNYEIKKSLPLGVKIASIIEENPFEIPLTFREIKSYLCENKKLFKVKNNNSQKTCDDILLSAKNLYFKYSKNSDDILKGLSFQLNKGEVLSVIGGNGVGKSTLLSIIASINKCYSGKIKIDKKTKITYLAQNPIYTFVQDCVIDDIKTFIKINNIDETEIDNLINKYEFFKDIKDKFNSNPLDLSGGEIQKMALFKVLLLKSNLILLDEVTKGLDLVNKTMLGDIIKALKNDGVSFIIVSHDLEFVAKYSDKVMMLFDGDKVCYGSNYEVFTSNNFYTTKFKKLSKGIFDNTIIIEDVVKNKEI